MRSRATHCVAVSNLRGGDVDFFISLPTGLQKIVVRCLAKAPSERYASRAARRGRAATARGVFRFAKLRTCNPSVNGLEIEFIAICRSGDKSRGTNKFRQNRENQIHLLFLLFVHHLPHSSRFALHSKYSPQAARCVRVDLNSEELASVFGQLPRRTHRCRIPSVEVAWLSQAPSALTIFWQCPQLLPGLQCGGTSRSGTSVTQFFSC